MAFDVRMIGVALVAAFLAWLAFRMTLGAVKNAVAIPLALGFGACVYLSQIHPGIAVVGALAVYFVAGKAVEFSVRLLIGLVVLAGVGWAAYTQLGPMLAAG